MVQCRFPSAPTFPTLRPATGADIARIADLSVRGFQDSEIFLYTRPRYPDFPQDAVASFANLYRSQLLDPQAVVIVTEDWRSADEHEGARSPPTSHLPPAKDPGLSSAYGWRVVVGVASWILPEHSPRIGQFVARDVGDPEAAPDRDLSRSRQGRFDATKSAGEQEFLAGQLICDKLVVHPHYRTRGHAKLMLRWGMRMAELDGVDSGVIPSLMGEPVYLGLGYQVVGEIHVPGDDEAAGFTLRVVTYRAQRLTAAVDAREAESLHST